MNAINGRAIDNEDLIRKLEKFVACDQPNASFFKSDVEDAIRVLKNLKKPVNSQNLLKDVA